jgi:hypothetical protein
VLFGAEFLNNEIGNYSVGAMQLRNYLLHLKEKRLLPGDRADIILGALQANESARKRKTPVTFLSFVPDLVVWFYRDKESCQCLCAFSCHFSQIEQKGGWKNHNYR